MAEGDLNNCGNSSLISMQQCWENDTETIIISSDEAVDALMREYQCQVQVSLELLRVNLILKCLSTMSILDFSNQIKDEISSITSLKSKNILKRFYCYNNQDSIVNNIILTHTQIFQCNSCHKRYSKWNDSMFINSKLILFVYCVFLLWLFACFTMFKFQNFNHSMV